MEIGEGNGATDLQRTMGRVLQPPEDIEMHEGAPHRTISPVLPAENDRVHKPNEALAPQPPYPSEKGGEAAQPQCVDGVLNIQFTEEEQLLLNKHRE